MADAKNGMINMAAVKKTVVFFIGLLAVLFLNFSPPLQAAEQAELMERWLVSDSLSTRVVDHGAWAVILGTYLLEDEAGQTRFDYGAVTPEDRNLLDGYIRMLSRVDVDRLTRDEQMAYWINAYNALIVSIVLSEYPVKSINDIGGWFFSPGPWKEKRFRVYLIRLSLNDIYHRILRPIWQDQRVHYAISCAAKGCAALKPTPFSGATIETDLELGAYRFVNDGPAILTFRGEAITVSRIYEWYAEDFGGSEQIILDYLKSVANGDLAFELARVEHISGHGFDWSLNDIRGQN